MALHDRIRQQREAALERGESPVPQSFQGITKQKIRAVLTLIDRCSSDTVDAVFALLDDNNPSWFSGAPSAARFYHGATTAHVACHVGILQRGTTKLDREGRDYWLKPLWEIGAIEKVYFDSGSREFIAGHPIAKSPNCAYRLANSFCEILKAPDGQWEALLEQWIKNDAIRERLRIQAQLAEQDKQLVNTKHSGLISACIKHYAPLFLPGFEAVYFDDGDGDRITEEDRDRLKAVGIDFSLADSMPDVLLWSAETDRLWVIEAVTSDGEVDAHKVQQLVKLAERSGKSRVGFTTAYPSWRLPAERQGRHKNIQPGTYIWIAEDPSKQFKVETY